MHVHATDVGTGSWTAPLGIAAAASTASSAASTASSAVAPGVAAQQAGLVNDGCAAVSCDRAEICRGATCAHQQQAAQLRAEFTAAARAHKDKLAELCSAGSAASAVTRAHRQEVAKLQTALASAAHSHKEAMIQVHAVAATAAAAAQSAHVEEVAQLQADVGRLRAELNAAKSMLEVQERAHQQQSEQQRIDADISTAAAARAHVEVTRLRTQLASATDTDSPVLAQVASHGTKRRIAAAAVAPAPTTCYGFGNSPWLARVNATRDF
eukprot:TRINITY_DN1921_c0_g3_i2.p1 TRINITY_DN1921_c0_g3~~TRINITY_DN1921_c0_g3_i2.p1  ORF type:complete len:268 (-),score=78.48 TRINITY_DN1921_c0_g3_i2:432-1235(-)